MVLLLLALSAAASPSISTAEFCADPTLGPGGSRPKYCQSASGQTVSTAYFTMEVPAGGWFAVSDGGRRGAMQPDLSMSMLMLSVTVLTPSQSIERRAKNLGNCTVSKAGAEWFCENEVGGDKTLERLLIGEEYTVRVFLSERWSGPLVQTYRSAVTSVGFAH
ncbi:MAG: hypothetical protein AAF385_00175 [Pseudomonadota bacterium]